MAELNDIWPQEEALWSARSAASWFNLYKRTRGETTRSALSLQDSSALKAREAVVGSRFDGSAIPGAADTALASAAANAASVDVPREAGQAMEGANQVANDSDVSSTNKRSKLEAVDGVGDRRMLISLQRILSQTCIMVSRPLQQSVDLPD